MKCVIRLFLFFCFSIPCLIQAQIVPVGSGSYTLTYPGTDAANRNQYPSGTPQLSGKALGKPVPTNDWWSQLIKENQASNLFSYPFTMRTLNNGLVVSYIPSGVIDDLLPITVGVTGMSSERTTVSDYSDWTVTMNWNDGVHQFEATAGIAMPFLYFTKGASDVAQITVTSGTVTVSGEMLLISNAKNGASFVAYAPAGSSWIKNNNTYTSDLNGKNYWSLAFIPLTASSISAVAEEYKQYAYVFPVNTTATWSFDEENSVCKTFFNVETEIKEGEGNVPLIGLLPHQWSHLASGSPRPEQYSYASIRGEIKTLANDHFTVENTFYGILPTLPYVETINLSFSEEKLKAKIEAMQNDEIGTWTDSYNDGQLLNRLVQTARVAGEMGNIEARNVMLETIKDRVENWLKAESGEVAFLFYYNKDWSALIGYPAGHGQDNNLNDHHFHWGYFIHAAAYLEECNPGWASEWGGMINLLVRDAASIDRSDSMFPYLRNFSPYAGHCWANGFATFPQGNDQESTSESMQFNSSLIHWGTITGNNAIRDLGIYLYTTEQTAIEEYWFDVNDRNFPATQQYSLVSRVWGNSFDNGTFWTNDIAASYGIELYPIHGGSLYLSHNIEYVNKLWKEICNNTGILRNEANDNLWHDVMWQYQSFVDPAGAIALYDSYPDRNLKFGVSDPQTYHWIHAMNILGQVDATITADYPIAAVFNQNGRMTYVAHNYGASSIVVTFSDGYKLSVPAREMVTASAGSVLPVVSLISPVNNTRYNTGETVTIQASAVDYSGSIVRVDFYQDDQLIGSDDSAPYSMTWTPGDGTYTLSAKAVNSAGKTGTSKTVTVVFSTDSSCLETSTEAAQGHFDNGYIMSFETVGSDVTIRCEFLDNKNGVVAYLWNYTQGFQETGMTETETKIFSTTLQNQIPGTSLTVACKFAYEAGMAVTKQFEYVVGTQCGTNFLNNSYSDERLQCYPNPVEDILYLQLPGENNRVTIWNMRGEKKLDRRMSANGTLDMSGFESGIYFLRVETESGKFTDKIMKR